MPFPRLRLASALLVVSLALPAEANDTLFASGFEPVWVLGYHVGYEATIIRR